MGIVIILFFVLLILGIPITFTMGLSSMAYLLMNGKDLIIIAQRFFAGGDSFTLMAIPLFIFAGEVMTSCGVTTRLVRFANSLVGFIPGGLAHVNVVDSMMMGGISGSTTADIASIGAMLVDAMDKAGYDRKYATALSAASATMGSIIPPSIIMVVYASITGISVGKLFIAGIIPGIMTGALQMIYVYYKAKKNPGKYYGSKTSFSLRELRKTFIDAIPAIIMPVIIIGGILSGVFTATEAGAIASAYGILVGIFVYKEFDVKRVIRTAISSMKTTGMTMLIVASAMLFSYCLAIERFPVRVSSAITGISENPNIVMFMMILVMIVVGCFMDTTSAAIIVVPIFAPIAASLGINEIHFAMVMVLTFILGGITPPVGVTLYVASAVAKISLIDIMKEMWQFIIIALIVLFAVAYIPQICLFLPNFVR